MPEDFLRQLRDALESIHEERFFQTERGFQGELLAALQIRLHKAAFPGDPIIEQEYQKRLPDHGLRIRPDLIIHIPFERGRAEKRDEGNFVAIELKLRATAEQATDAFNNLAQLKEILHYPLTVFINIATADTHRGICPLSIVGQTICCAVRRENGRTVVNWQEA